MIGRLVRSEFFRELKVEQKKIESENKTMIVKFYILSLLALAIYGKDYKQCNHGLSATTEELLKVTKVDLKHSTANNFYLNFEGIALKPISDPIAQVEVFLYGVSILTDSFSTCRSREQAQARTWLRTSTDERKCDYQIGNKVSGTIPLTMPGNLVGGSDLELKLTIKDTKESSCIRETFSFSTDLWHESFLEGTRFGFSDEEIDFLWTKYIIQHSENLFLPESRTPDDIKHLHSTSVLEKRKKIFNENLIKIAVHNKDKDQSYTMSMNHFGHITSEEFKFYFASGLRPELSTKPFADRYKAEKTYISEDSLPSEVNWVTSGAVTEVKNQGACGSCWSFSATGALEGAYFLKTGKLVSFSEQELVSCDHVDLGCNGGAMDNAWQFAEQNNGLCSEEGFPYTSGQGVRGFCNTTCKAVEGSLPTNIVDVQHDEISLQQAVAQQPVSVAIEADESAFQFYSSGVLTAHCSQRLDHGVLVVGYGKDPDQNVDYWLVKNSWGPMWGLNGYIKLERGVELEEGGECGVLLGPSYPEL